MNNQILRKVIQEQLESVFKESEEKTVTIDTQKMVDNLSTTEEELALDILGDDMLEEGSFSNIKEKFNKALKSGAMTLGVLAAVLSTPDMAQAQKEELKKDVTNSTWFLDQQRDFENDETAYSKMMGRYVNSDDYDQDLEDAREPGTPNEYSMEKWVNNLGQDSTVYKQYQDSKWTPDAEGNMGYEYSNPSDPVKTVVNKDVKPWAGGEKGNEWAQMTKKGDIGNYLWSKDKKSSITPEIHKELKKLEKGKKYDYNSWKSVKAKKYQDDGFSSSDFQNVDLKNINSPS